MGRVDPSSCLAIHPSNQLLGRRRLATESQGSCRRHSASHYCYRPVSHVGSDADSRSGDPSEAFRSGYGSDIDRSSVKVALRIVPFFLPRKSQSIFPLPRHDKIRLTRRGRCFAISDIVRHDNKHAGEQLWRTWLLRSTSA